MSTSSFEQWFPRLLPFAFNVGWRFFGGNRVMAEDVAQEALTRAYVVWPKVVAHPKPEAWVSTTALHVALELARQNARAHRPQPVGTLPNVPDEEERVVDADVLAQAFGRLSDHQRQVLLWRFYFDYSVKGTAEVLGLSESKVKDATHEATTKLSRLLPGLEG